MKIVLNSARAIRLVLAGWLFMSVWAQAQLSTNGSSASKSPSAASGIKGDAKVWLTFGLDQIPLLQYRPVAEIPIWQYLASLIFVVLAFYASRLIDAFLSGRARRWSARTATKLDDLAIELLRGPVRVISFVILLHLGMNVYAWPQALEDFFSKALKLVVAISITYVLLRAVDAFVRVWRERTTTPENEAFSKQLLPLIRKSIKVFVVIVAILVTSQNLGLNVTGLIASLSIGGLAIGLAAQDTLANLFGAVAVLVDKPFRVGDRIQLEGVDGTVESIGFRSTRVRNLDGHLITVPNKTMGNATITNIAMRPSIRTVMNLGIECHTPPDRVRRATEILEEIFKNHPKTQEVSICFNKFADSALNLQVIHIWKGTDNPEYVAGIQEFNLKIKQRFEAEGISFAYPSQTLYLRQETA